MHSDKGVFISILFYGLRANVRFTQYSEQKRVQNIRFIRKVNKINMCKSCFLFISFVQTPEKIDKFCKIPVTLGKVCI